MANSIRIEKVTSEIQKALSQIIQTDVRDVRVQEHFGSITRIDLSRDMQYARVFISVYGPAEDQKDFMEGLESAKGYIRSELGRRVRLRVVPELNFKLDHALEQGTRVLSLLNEMKERGEL